MNIWLHWVSTHYTFSIYRFRQIKEQEAKRKQEREEDKIKVEAAKASYSVDDSSNVNGSHYSGTNNGGIAHSSSLGIDDSPENGHKVL